MMRKWLTLAGLALCLCGGNPLAQATGEDVAVTTSRRVHPVLIRNEHNILLQIVVDVHGAKEVRLKALHFAFDKSDDVGDLASLALFATGDKQEFSPTSPFGKTTDPAGTVAFRADLALRRGKNVFWLSGRLKPTADLSHRIAAICAAVETTAGKSEANDLSPGIRQRIGFALRKHKDDGVHTYRIPALTTSPKGTLLCVYDMRRRMGRDLQEDIDIGLSRSTDGGSTWEPVRVIMDMGKYRELPEEQNGCSDPGIIVDQKTGEVFCFAVWMNGNPGKHQWTGDGSLPGYEIGKAAQMLMVRSKDDGRTWSKPENLTRKLKKEAWWLFAPSPQQGINLADGTLVMPAQGRDEKGKEFSTIMTSRDHGETWTVAAPAYSGGSECQAVQLGDGSIMLNMRNEHEGERFRAVFVTKDWGKSWQPHVTNRKTLIEPNCNGSLLRVDYTEAGAKKHVLLFANPHSQKGRTHQTIQVSFDDGRTWPEKHHHLLDEGRGAGYPSLTRIDERHVGIVYEGSQAHLVFEKILLDELLGLSPWVGYTELRTNLPGGRHANVKTMRAAIVRTDGTGRRLVADELAREPDTWTQFAGWSPDGKSAIVSAGWQSPENAKWEEENKTFRMDEGKWKLDSCLLDLASGKIVNVTAVERVSNYNGGLFFLPDGRGLGFTPLIKGVSKPYVMDLDGRNKRDVSGKSAGFSYGYSSSPDGKFICYHENYQIHVSGADGTKKLHIKTGHSFNFAPKWSPDGNWLLFVSGEHYNCHPHIVRSDGAGLKKLADRGGYKGVIDFLDVFDFHQGSSDTPAWSTDGKTVYFTAKVGKNVELLETTLDGKATQLTRTAEGSLHYHPQPSPDGKWIIYGSMRDGARNIYVMNLADRTEKRITNLKPGHGAMWPHWQPRWLGRI